MRDQCLSAGRDSRRYAVGCFTTITLAPKTQTDLVHWTKPTLVMTLQDLLARDPAGSYDAYYSLLDPAAPDRNLTVVVERSYLYYVGLNYINNEDRVLFRQPIRLSLNQ